MLITGIVFTQLAIFSYLQKRLLNVKSPRKKERTTKAPVEKKKRRLYSDMQDDDEDLSGGSTIILDQTSDNSEDLTSPYDLSVPSCKW